MPLVFHATFDDTMDAILATNPIPISLSNITGRNLNTLPFPNGELPGYGDTACLYVPGKGGGAAQYDPVNLPGSAAVPNDLSMYFVLPNMLNANGSGCRSNLSDDAGNSIDITVEANQVTLGDHGIDVTPFAVPDNARMVLHYVDFAGIWNMFINGVPAASFVRQFTGNWTSFSIQTANSVEAIICSDFRVYDEIIDPASNFDPSPPVPTVGTAKSIHKGDQIDFRSVIDIQAGQVVVNNDLLAISLRDLKAGQLGSLATRGVFDLPKEPVVINEWTNVFWNISNGTVDPSSGIPLGLAVETKQTGDSTIRVRLVQ